MSPVKSASLLLVALLSLSIAGLALPSITVNVQEVGSGSCDLSSPVDRADVTVGFQKSGSLVITWTLENVILSFPTSLPAGTVINLTMVVEGYRYWTDNQPTRDTIRLNTTLSSDASVVVLGVSNTYTYQSLSLRGIDPPKVLNLSVVVRDGLHTCSSGSIPLSVQEIGIGSSSYSPPPVNVPIINVTVNNTNGPELRDYVLNFTVSSSCLQYSSGVYVTDSRGNPLYFWYFNDSTHNKIWFWVNYTVPAYSTGNILIHLNGSGVSPYLNPEKVFWNFTSYGSGISLGNDGVSNVDYLYINTTLLSRLGYYGYISSIYLNLSVPSGTNPGPIWDGAIEYYNGYLYFHGLGIIDFLSNYYLCDPQLEFDGTQLRYYQAYWFGFNKIDSTPAGKTLVDVVFSNQSADVSLYFNGSFEGSNAMRSVGSGPLWLSPIFIYGQYLGSSVYYWVGIRPYVPKAPTVEVPSECSAPKVGDYTFTIYFRP